VKTLTLLRHAKSGHDPHVARDFDRALNDKGRRAAVIMGRHARSLGLTFDRIVASPAIRVSETMTAFAQGYAQALTPIWDRRLYLASATTLLDVVASTPETDSNLLLIGHNPGLEDLVLMLAADAELRTAVEQKFPTASIAQLHFTGPWSECGAGQCTIAAFVRPRDLDPHLGPDCD
jgi:phosphohistidine phosphatase